jgi:hypothetical protein
MSAVLKALVGGEWPCLGKALRFIGPPRLLSIVVLAEHLLISKMMARKYAGIGWPVQ